MRRNQGHRIALILSELRRRQVARTSEVRRLKGSSNGAFHQFGIQDVIDARPSIATVKLDVGANQTLRAQLEWSEPSPAATLARAVALELAEIDPARLKRCERPACKLVFYDSTRSGRQRWHAESPCGNRERQRRYRAASRVK